MAYQQYKRDLRTSEDCDAGLREKTGVAEESHLGHSGVPAIVESFLQFSQGSRVLSLGPPCEFAAVDGTVAPSQCAPSTHRLASKLRPREVEERTLLQ